MSSLDTNIIDVTTILALWATTGAKKARNTSQPARAHKAKMSAKKARNADSAASAADVASATPPSSNAAAWHPSRPSHRTSPPSTVQRQPSA